MSAVHDIVYLVFAIASFLKVYICKWGVSVRQGLKCRVIIQHVQLFRNCKGGRGPAPLSLRNI